MRLLSSLQNRIFLASATVAVLSIAFPIHFVTTRLEREVEAELERGLGESASLVEQQHAARLQALVLMARLIADLPKLKAAVDTNEPTTVQPTPDWQEGPIPVPDIKPPDGPSPDEVRGPVPIPDIDPQPRK